MKKLARIIPLLALVAALAWWPAASRAQFADQATFASAVGGTANAITLTVPNWTRNLTGVPIRFIPAAQNTSATTVVVNGVGSAIAIDKKTGNGLTALSGGELTTTNIAEITFDGTQWQLSSTPQVGAIPLQGYLTPCQVSSPSPVAGCTAGQYVPTSTVASATTLYYESVLGNLVPIFNGGAFTPTPVSESQMTLILSGTANTANNAYDVCIYSNAGTPTIGTMPAWSNSGGGTSARSAAITQIQGVWVNNASTTVTNNNVGTTVAANKCTVVASILIDSVNGQVTFNRAWGQNSKWSVWNFGNRVSIVLQSGDSTASWTYNSATPRAANGNSGNHVVVFTGLPADVPTIELNQMISTSSGSGTQGISGIGVNVTNAFSGTPSHYQNNSGTLVSTQSTAVYYPTPSLGRNDYYAVEAVAASTSPITFYGTQSFMTLIAKFNG